MEKHDHDIIIVGGGLGGSALAIAMTGHGARVLVIERDLVFKDRVRGEGMFPWGVAEARALGIYEALRDACGHEVALWDIYAGPAYNRRNVVETTPQVAPILGFSHPEMQEAMLRAAAASGAEVRRGAVVTGVSPGEPPSVTVEHDGKVETLTARLVVGVDGRASRVRSWAGFTAQQDAPRLFVGGVLLEGGNLPVDAVSLVQGFGRSAIFFPQRNGRCRAYCVYHRELRNERLQGPADMPAFIESSMQAGTPPGWLDGVRAVGPLATFEGADSWAPHPYRDGVVLIGDAAATSDPSWGQGLSLTMRDVRTLRDALIRGGDWNSACHAYAEEHDRYYATLHAVEDWYTKLFMEVGPHADARRGKALPLMMQDPTRVPDVLISGPNKPLGEEDRIRFIGE
jgi:menaquinone-9 beta-reductase